MARTSVRIRRPHAFEPYPHGNFTGTGADNINLTGYIFNTPEHNVQNTYISRWDYNIDDAGKHRLFVRGQLQDFWSSGAEQFPGQAPASVGLNNSKGTAVGYTWLVKPLDLDHQLGLHPCGSK